MNRDRKDLDKLDSLIDGRRDGRNGWINARRARKDRAYAVGVALGEYEYQQFLAGPSNPALGYVPPEPPAEIYEPFLAILMARSVALSFKIEASIPMLLAPPSIISATRQSQDSHITSSAARSARLNCKP